MSNLAKPVPIVLSLLLVAMWLILSGELSVAHLVLGVLLSLALVLAIAELRPVRPRLRRLSPIIALVAHVMVDIFRSNFHVASVILGLGRKESVRSGFLEIPIELTDPHGLATLAVIVTATPGTSWAGLSDSGRVLTLHVLELTDEETLIRTIKRRYEQPLIRIFE